MVLYGLAGICTEDNSLSFSPYLPEDIRYLEIKHVRYHQAELNITLKGNGKKIKSLTFNGKKQEENSVYPKTSGLNEVVIEME